MNTVIGLVLGFISFFVGVFGFSQIIGSIQHIKTRKVSHTIITIVLWTVILMGYYFGFNNFFSSFMRFFYGGFIISFLASLRNQE